MGGGHRRTWRCVAATPGTGLEVLLPPTSVHEDSPWSPSPAGLSSDGYNGHVFWDTETWIWPALLAQHPHIARSVLDYRLARLDAARVAASEGGHRGARFPWESGLTGEEDTPDWAPFGRLEQHISADVALAFWQYWLATGDRQWAAYRGAAGAERDRRLLDEPCHPDAEGRCHINGVIPPDEYAVGPHDDSVYTTRRRPGVPALRRRSGTGPRRERRSAVGRGREAHRRSVRRSARYPPGVRRLRGTDDQAGRCGDARLSVGEPAALAGHTCRPGVLRDPHPRGRAVDDGLGALHRARRTRRRREGLRVHPAQRRTVRETAFRAVRRSPHGRCLHLPDRPRRLPAGVPVRLFGAAPSCRPDRPRADPARRAGVHHLQRLCWRGRVFDVDIRSDGTTVRLRSGERLPVETAGTLRHVPTGESSRSPRGRPHDIDEVPRHPPVRQGRRGCASRSDKGESLCGAELARTTSSGVRTRCKDSAGDSPSAPKSGL
ncbi:hypothetical protein E4K10_00085 [Streptomyces sp. T1317-0309]|nr:hypothetical protein E4K10_00085 [Streptomyces sp. T1317-0309]